MKLGVHCSIAGGLTNALLEAKRLKCESIQIFTRSPRVWKAIPHSKEAISAFRQQRESLRIGPLMVHLAYLPNLCTTDARLLAMSQRVLEQDLALCNELGIEYLVVHPGTASEGCAPEQGIAVLSQAMDKALANVGGPVMVLLENMAGSGSRLGGTFEHLAAMRDGVREKKRIGFCLDTAHTLAAGYGFSTAAEVRETMAQFEKILGLKNLKAIHANDSKTPRGSHVDRHQHIGKGYVGLEAFEALVNYPGLDDVPFILETPKDSPRDDLRNLRALRKMRH